MALHKSKTLANGSEGLTGIVAEAYDRQTRKITWSIALFKDQEHSMSAHLGLCKNYTFSVTPQEAMSNRTAMGYVKIKAKAETLVTKNLMGELLEEPIPFDPDLAGAENS